VPGFPVLLGGSILTALVSVRAAPVIAAPAFLELALATAKTSEGLQPPLGLFFTLISMIFGSGAAVAMVIFLVEQLRGLLRKR
jgi:hypothetical protein